MECFTVIRHSTSFPHIVITLPAVVDEISSGAFYLQNFHYLAVGCWITNSLFIELAVFFRLIDCSKCVNIFKRLATISRETDFLSIYFAE